MWCQSTIEAAIVRPVSIDPLRFLMLVFSGWVNRHQLDMIEYLKEENRVLREQLGVSNCASRTFSGAGSRSRAARSAAESWTSLPAS